MGEKELQEKLMTYRVLEARLEGLVKQRDMLVNKIIELQSTLQSLDDLEKSESEILFPIGGNAFKSAKIVNRDRLIVEIGANVALEKSTEDGRAIIKKRKDELENFVNHMQEEMVKISNAVNQLGPELQAMADNMQKQAG